MPSYEYKCLDCKKTFEIFLSYAEYDAKVVLCSYCSSERIERVIRPVRVARSEESYFENLADPSMLAGLEDDPKALGQMMRKMGNELGEDMGSEFDEVIDRLGKGQSPEDIEKALPDLNAGDEPMGGDLNF